MKQRLEKLTHLLWGTHKIRKDHGPVAFAIILAPNIPWRTDIEVIVRDRSVYITRESKRS